MRDAGYLASPYLVELGRRKNIEKHINSEEKKKAKEDSPAITFLTQCPDTLSPALYSTHTHSFL